MPTRHQIQDTPDRLRRGIPGLLRRAADLRGFTISYHLARYLGIEHNTMRRWWSGESVPNSRDCVFLAVKLAIPEHEVERCRVESMSSIAQAS